MTPVSKIVIVGGGTAGWLTAGTLAAKFKREYANPPKVVLIESPGIPIIGVGEGTWPTMRKTLKSMGIREADFLNECQATFKQGALFAQWVTGEDEDAYYHPLVLPTGYFERNLVHHWQHHKNELGSFAAAVCPQVALCDAGLAPKSISTPEYGAIANYAYHLDAGKFAAFLQKHCVGKLGVEHVLADMTTVRSGENGNILAIKTKQAGEIAGDLFVDCTGTRALLISGHFGVPFRSCKDKLFVDRALAMQVPYGTSEEPIATHTISTAQKVGWVWDIGVQSRRGVGHVFSSAHSSEAEAEKRLHAYVRKIGADPEKLESRLISIDPGHREEFWVGNCVAVGLAAGFLEPLEASAILLIEISAQFIAEQFPDSFEAMPLVSARYNQTFRYRWDRIIDFLKLHYVLSQRDDDAFWIDNRDPATIPQSLQDLLLLWRYQPPWHDDFDRAVEVFPAASYQYILYGMGFKTAAPAGGFSVDAQNEAKMMFSFNVAETRKIKEGLPSHRALLDKIARYGLARV